MKRTTPGYRARWSILWRDHATRPALMGWALEAARRMRARGHTVTVVAR